MITTILSTSSLPLVVEKSRDGVAVDCLLADNWMNPETRLALLPGSRIPTAKAKAIGTQH